MSKQQREPLDGGQIVPDVMLDEKTPLGPTVRELAEALVTSKQHIRHLRVGDVVEREGLTLTVRSIRERSWGRPKRYVAYLVDSDGVGQGALPIDIFVHLRRA